MHDSPFTHAATFVVVANGALGRQIADLAQQLAEFDPDCRRVLRPGDAKYPAPAAVAACSNGDTAAFVVDGFGRICAVLNRQQAIGEAWIEDAFLRARRCFAA
jgi:hypothetical protein